MHPTDTRPCFASHMGLYLADQGFVEQAVSLIKQGHDGIVSAHFGDPLTVYAAERVEFAHGVFGQVTKDGIAVLSMSGVMSKGGSAKFGGVSTIGMRNAIRSMAQDDDVQAVVLSVDSPGGQAAGTAELAADLQSLAGVKRVFVQIEDLAASAGAWVALQGSEVAVNATGRVGSFGTYIVLEDSSEQAEREGVKVHVVSTGPLKGAFTEGTEITDEMLASVQGMVDDMNQFFIDAVQSARALDDDTTKAIFTGETFSAARSLELGLVDHVRGFDETMAAAQEYVQGKEKVRRARASIARRR